MAETIVGAAGVVGDEFDELVGTKRWLVGESVVPVGLGESGVVVPQIGLIERQLHLASTGIDIGVDLDDVDTVKGGEGGKLVAAGHDGYIFTARQALFGGNDGLVFRAVGRQRGVEVVESTTDINKIDDGAVFEREKTGF